MRRGVVVGGQQLGNMGGAVAELGTRAARLDHCHADAEDALLTHCLARDQRRELQHEAHSGVQIAVLEDIVECEIVEDLDELRIGDLQSRDMARKQFFMVSA